MTYSEAIQFLYDLRMFGAKFGLENTFKLAALAGGPQQKLRFIHVAGTNGKGSTCAMLESIYRAAGLRTGLFTSPHLVSFSERIQVNRQLIPDADVIRLVSGMQTLLKNFPAAEHPTFFEVVTVMALQYFAEQRCELVIWETGLGGRLDATNIVTPLLSIVTNVDYDHQKWLGDTLPQIAFEKAGIIKAGIPVVTAAEEPTALQVIRQTAREKHSPLIEVTANAPAMSLARSIDLPLPGEHQRINAALAITGVRLLQGTIPVNDVQLRTGLNTVFWPGRFQVCKREAQTIVLDGAHNAAGAACLVKALAEQFPNVAPTLIVGALNDKDWKTMAASLAPIAGNIFLVPVHTDRAIAPGEMAPAFIEAHPDAVITVCESLGEALEVTAKDAFLIITGSLYLIGEAIELLGISASRNERGLNEWQPAASNRK